MQTSQDLLCVFSALFPRNMAQTGASAILLHADVNYSGGREWWAVHICRWMMSPPALRKPMKHKSQPSVGRILLIIFDRRYQKSYCVHQSSAWTVTIPAIITIEITGMWR